MDENYFWEIIKKSNSQNEKTEYPEMLVKELKKLKPQQIVEFYQNYIFFHEKADIGDVWAAGMLLNGGHGSDDGFKYFRNWLIAQGRTVYEQALINPDSLASLNVELDAEGRPYAEWESFGYAADYAYEELTKKNLFDDAEQSDMIFSLQERLLEKKAWNWQDYNDEVIAKKLPDLWKKYGKFAKS
jgi:Protein of unknown function (DUF4240)